MASVEPVNVSDLNGIEINPGDIISDELCGYVSYVKNLCTDLGTPKDSPEGYKDFLDFQKEIEAARISTFEPESIDDSYTFENVDLTGENLPVANIAMTMYMMAFGKSLLFANSGHGFTPFDDKSLRKDGYYMSGNGINPFDETGGAPIAKKEEVALTA